MSSKSPLKKLESPNETTNGFSITNNDRALNKDEEEAELKAETFSVKHKRRIHPIMGTLGFLLRNFSNDVVNEQLRIAAEKDASIKLKQIINRFDKLDEFSQRRVDVFDHLCRDLKIERHKFWGWFQQGNYLSLDMIKETALSEMGLKVLEATGKFALKEKNFKDRELAAKMTKLIGDRAIVEINETRNTTNNILNVGSSNSPFGNFTSSIRKVDEQIRGNNVDETRLLEEGSREDFIDAEFSTNENEEEFEKVSIESEREN